MAFPATIDTPASLFIRTIKKIQEISEAGFDLVLIAADKDGYPAYLPKAVALVRAGGLILPDNTLPDEGLDPRGDSGTKRCHSAVAAHPALVSTIVPVLRRQGFDGLTISIKQV